MAPSGRSRADTASSSPSLDEDVAADSRVAGAAAGRSVPAILSRKRKSDQDMVSQKTIMKIFSD